MNVQKVSVSPYFGNSSSGIASSQVPQNPATLPAKQPKKDYTKAIAFATAGLALAGLAGVLIYNARKGKASGGASDPLVGVGTYLRKFLDDSIFAKSAEKAKDASSGINLKVSEDGNDWQLCDFTRNFGCRLVKQVPKDKAEVPNFEFSSTPLQIKIFNKDTNSAKFDFILGECEDFKLSIDAEPWRGKVSSCSATDGQESYSFTNEKCQEILDNLDLQKLLDDDSYRVSYINSLFQTVGDTVSKTKFQKIADKTGKSFDEIQNIYKSKEFNEVLDVRDIFGLLHSRYGLLNTPYESEIFKTFKDKDSYAMLEDFLSGNKKFNIMDDFVDTDVHFPQDKTCYDITLPTEDGIDVLERLRVSKDGEYVLYEKSNPQDAADKLKVRYYYPQLDEQNCCITDLETKGASLYLETTSSGRNYVEVTHPNKTDGPLKFYFNSNRQWNEDIDYGDELQPYMGYIEKIATSLSDDSLNWKFIRDFSANGQKILEELAK